MEACALWKLILSVALRTEISLCGGNGLLKTFFGGQDLFHWLQVHATALGLSVEGKKKLYGIVLQWNFVPSHERNSVILWQNVMSQHQGWYMLSVLLATEAEKSGVTLSQPVTFTSSPSHWF